MNRKTIYIVAMSIGVLTLGLGLGLGLGLNDNNTTNNSNRNIQPEGLTKITALETVWLSAAADKTPPSSLTDNQTLSTTSSIVSGFDIISYTNTHEIPTSTSRSVVTNEATTIKNEYEKNNSLYIVFDILASNTVLSTNGGTFPATYNSATQRSNEVTVNSIDIIVKVAKSPTSGIYDELNGYTASFTYDYYFRDNPEPGKTPTKVLTLRLKDFTIKYRDQTVLLKNADYKSGNHDPDTTIFLPASIILKK